MKMHIFRAGHINTDAIIFIIVNHRWHLVVKAERKSKPFRKSPNPSGSNKEIMRLPHQSDGACKLRSALWREIDCSFGMSFVRSKLASSGPNHGQTAVLCTAYRHSPFILMNDPKSTQDSIYLIRRV